jgi:hypothetical protein
MTSRPRLLATALFLVAGGPVAGSHLSAVDAHPIHPGAIALSGNERATVRSERYDIRPKIKIIKPPRRGSKSKPKIIVVAPAKTKTTTGTKTTPVAESNEYLLDFDAVMKANGVAASLTTTYRARGIVLQSQRNKSKSGNAVSISGSGPVEYTQEVIDTASGTCTTTIANKTTLTVTATEVEAAGINDGVIPLTEPGSITFYVTLRTQDGYTCAGVPIGDAVHQGQMVFTVSARGGVAKMVDSKFAIEELTASWTGTAQIAPKTF